jgi:hypothetical protein
MEGCITHHFACDCREARINKLVSALIQIASYDEGPEVTSAFDEPHSARVARKALEEWEETQKHRL